MAKRCRENITKVVKCVKLHFPKVLRSFFVFFLVCVIFLCRGCVIFLTSFYRNSFCFDIILGWVWWGIQPQFKIFELVFALALHRRKVNWHVSNMGRVGVLYNVQN